MTGIKESLDVLKVPAVVADALLAAKADGQLDAMDAMRALPVVQALKDAWTGSDQLDDELKELSKEELVVLVKAGADSTVKLVLALLA